MDNELVAHTKEELNNLIDILLNNDKTVKVEKTILQNFLVTWEDPAEDE